MTAAENPTPDVPIGDYAVVGDMRTAALISPEGSVDWLCLPRFDSPSVFAALLGTEQDGRWLVRVVGGHVEKRDYVEGTFVFRTVWQGPEGSAEVTTFMPHVDGRSDIVRVVRCTSGTVEIEHELIMRFDYATVRPWVHRTEIEEEDGAVEEVLTAVGGPSRLILHGPLPEPVPEEDAHRARHTLAEGEELCWVLTGQASWKPLPSRIDVDAVLEETIDDWCSWSGQIEATGPWARQVTRSLTVLRALTHKDTGGIVAAATTSLPENPGGERNWDYRYTWLRDSALTLQAMVLHGLDGGAQAWKDWLLRAIAGHSNQLRIMYGLAGERDLLERELPNLRGYADSRPVRIGNGAADQYQADVIGEVMLALADLRRAGIPEGSYSWGIQKMMLDTQAERLHDPDHGIWEMRGDKHFFTHGRVMVWAAFDQGIKAVEEHDLSGDVEHWRTLRDRVRAEIDEQGVGPGGAFRQTYGADEVDASLLQIPHTGFCDYDDPRMLATVERLERELVDDQGFLHRYRMGEQHNMDGLRGAEAPFLICTFWLVEQYARTGRIEDAERLMQACVDAGAPLDLLAEEYDPASRRMLGNYPQAFSHLGLVRAADAIAHVRGESG
ncbi:Glucoamylase [Serinicoccus hydrothermalis]|uniref:Glucoamylase n=1 Tax=Serinicoccus hydrothermalis TaxID=1758689 RepID=A0A1B1NAT3_9MICO|nr:glycoside hydrolase family 15 protein [Serinicoccus hydrothermalis]ANS78543.1 Glucoamylase [Serinicoccus hydrothermalis]